MKTKILNRDEMVDFVCSLARSAMVWILLADDLLSCCDEAVAAEVNGNIVGVATIAPEGEMVEGQPTIVAIYVLPDCRGHGYGRELMCAVVECCLARGFEVIRVDTLSTGGRKVVASLPEELRRYLDVRDMGMMFDLFPD